MKKLSLFAGVLCVLALTGCTTNAKAKETDSTNLRINEVTIPYSGFAVIPAGTVTGGTGNTINGYAGAFSAEGRDLEIPSFEMGKYEVTQRLYKAVMTGDENAASEPSYCSGDSTKYIYSDDNEEEKDLRPVENVSWYDAVYFCNKLSEKTGKVPYYTIKGITWSSGHITAATVGISDVENAAYGYRLPTEAEWEYAARGADVSAESWKYFFAGKSSTSTAYINADLDSAGWYWYNTVNGKTGDGSTTPSSGNKGYGTHRVGLKAPVSDSLKLYDMSGNVWEWCWDWYDTISADTPPAGPSSSPYGYRVGRGGSWGYNAIGCSVAYRHNNYPDYRYYYLGFRVVCSAQDTSN